MPVMDGGNLEVGIAVSLFNDDITKPMLEGALLCLEENKVRKDNIKVVFVPGSFEIPYFCQKLAKSGKYDALIAIGCVIKGETDHYYYIAGEVSRAIMDISLKYEIPVGFAIITTNNLSQAKDRAAGNNNKGYEAAEAILRVLRSEAVL
ncbi:MAG: 6,7-dimethyl-8-ribityllumazine synthase [Candidatus Taylorbacteria bacterium RIFCSPLOWO2_12_FULL_43_20]|uniref:6,7-dimethyl-8-ribityllumazine synthase n=1 Tax=Candidatus Taylorbacteria bacterium RIFCSPLOWO2_12_FULL_43_20 TaxID=1802332 RepID=A0A1G2P2P8_9BACT|nr:MAG: 6,7-dimethyl-8-ribityllumazine synthase [Candidatus Taylorbacteria bacterium RIFCSPHIGHO2_01_FULL_43_120]OHA22969.1 MAG: 6,7-dimethyl-8-ribityllumazine synthase [Candidatus Taylorbacteria bacterium RIFCSPHIGHO2_02_FULL_43_55]OHA30246.1 MAG: 6,7-dimethyl-8-ribityllumazine synthase [Candidatus Taylorbacteria bacterium RIFCSPHIGHO2_12_FULL_42_34]OHA31996.1 MAG: 6,7-dimethyl-8-ribityllumazine synthase [Candidatus Taylorbacteria bacterium RIFCSPLOWO2_01_FULL_43_83]OHA38019.1 MAG: 6,7-dimethy